MPAKKTTQGAKPQSDAPPADEPKDEAPVIEEPSTIAEPDASAQADEVEQDDAIVEAEPLAHFEPEQTPMEKQMAAAQAGEVAQRIQAEAVAAPIVPRKPPVAVIATREGFYKMRRYRGEAFILHDGALFSKRWMRYAEPGTAIKPDHE